MERVNIAREELGKRPLKKKTSPLIIEARECVSRRMESDTTKIGMGRELVRGNVSSLSISVAVRKENYLEVKKTKISKHATYQRSRI